MTFDNEGDSHKHSLFTLNILREHDDFMESVGSVIDLGCGKQMLDLEWWVTATTRDEEHIPLEIRGVGVDRFDETPHKVGKYPNMAYYNTDYNNPPTAGKDEGFDLLWSHDSFQYSLTPFETLRAWNNIANPGAMLVLIVPQTTNMVYNNLEISLPPFSYFHYSFTNLIYMLSVTGWDVSEGHFYKDRQDPFLHVICYKGEQGQLDPTKTSWYNLAEQELLPNSAAKSVFKYGTVKQNELVLPWIDKSLHDYSKH